MKVTNSVQSTLPPTDKPVVKDPVVVELDVPLYFISERGPTPSRTIFCAKSFVLTVLVPLQAIAQSQGWGLAHVGFYNPRKARHKDGTPIIPARWSNHAFGEAGDFKGFVDAEGELISINDLKLKHPDVYQQVLNQCKDAITAAGRRAEIVDEGGWLHIGMWPGQ